MKPKGIIIGNVKIDGNPRIIKLEPKMEEGELKFKTKLANNCNECPYKEYWKDENPNWREWICNAGYKLNYRECAFPTVKEFFKILNDYMENKSDTTLKDILYAFERNKTDVRGFLMSPENYIISRVE